MAPVSALALTPRLAGQSGLFRQDPERCRAAGIPEDAEFTTKPRQAQAMTARAVAAGVPFAWFTADEAYGQAKWLQAGWKSATSDPAQRRPDHARGRAGADALIAALPAVGDHVILMAADTRRGARPRP
jgi:hypothetical protein